MTPTTFACFSRRIWERLHPVGRLFGFRWVQVWRGTRYRVLSLEDEINPVTGRGTGPSKTHYLGER